MYTRGSENDIYMFTKQQQYKRCILRDLETAKYVSDITVDYIDGGDLTIRLCSVDR